MPEPVQLRWSLTTRAPQSAAWAVLCDTDRLNRLAGLEFSFSAAAEGDPSSRGTGAQRHLGLTLRWQERPVEFTVPSDIRIQREYENGPVSRVVNTLHLEPAGDGTRVLYEVQLWPRAALLKPMVTADVQLTVKPGLTRALQALLTALDAAADAPDQAPPPLDAQHERTLALRLRSLHDPELAARLGTFLRQAPLAEQTRMRPLALSRLWGLSPQRVTAGLLEAESSGLLALRWEVLCPACRMPSGAPRALPLRERQAHCGVCDLRYDASIADAVALVFQPAPEIRRVLATPRCLSSPARVPHLVSQRNLPPRGELDWTLPLEPGTYRLRSLPDLDVISITVHPDAARQAQTVLAGPATLGPPVLRLGPGRVTLHVRSKCERPLTLLLERPWREPDQLCVGELLSWPEVAGRLPADAMEPGVEVAPFEGLALAVQVTRGGAEAEEVVARALQESGVRALQVANRWITATLPDAGALVGAVTWLQDAPWLTSAVGHGLVVELSSGGTRMASGGLLQRLVGLAAEAPPGRPAALEPERWPSWTRATGLAIEAGELRLSEAAPAPLLPPAPPAELGPGAIVDARFTLAERLGVGGFGVVHAAHDAFTGQPVVVKLLKATASDTADVVQRFFDEGRLAARLSGRHAVRVYEWGVAEDGRLYIAMERLHGRELADLLHELGTLDPARTVRLTLDALAGLAEAHAQGLVHRDVKPANLFVVHEGQPDEHVKVIDFGIAVDLTGEVRSVDREGIIIGTPAFVSPEQVMGRPVDARSDLYSLGVVLHCCLVGSPPFEGDTPMALLYARMVVQPEPLAARAAQPLPEGLSELVERVLAMEPSDRPADALALARALDDIRRRMGDPARWVVSWQAHPVAGRAGLNTRPSAQADATAAGPRMTRPMPRE